MSRIIREDDFELGLRVMVASQRFPINCEKDFDGTRHAGYGKNTCGSPHTPHVVGGIFEIVGIDLPYIRLSGAFGGGDLIVIAKEFEFRSVRDEMFDDRSKRPHTKPKTPEHDVDEEKAKRELDVEREKIRRGGLYGSDEDGRHVADK